MRGIALRFGADDVDVGSLGSAIDMNSFSLTFYETRPKGENSNPIDKNQKSKHQLSVQIIVRIVCYLGVDFLGL